MAKPEKAQHKTRIKVTLVYSPAPRKVREWELSLEKGKTAAQGIAASGLLDEFPDLTLERLLIGVWGSKCSLQYPLEDNDRIEIYRDLRVDPKVARRERFNEQGAKTAGLFAKNRPGAKAGY